MSYVGRPKYLYLRILGTWLFEPFEQLRATFTYFFGWKKKFNFYNLNPVQITHDQAEKIPILLIHGNFHNQSAWLSLAKSLLKANLGPMYTVNLPHRQLTNKDFEIINAKINEIKHQYRNKGKENVRIDLIGHSRGAKIAYYVGIDESAWKFEEGLIKSSGKEVAPRKEIRKIIKLGYPTGEELNIFKLWENVFDIRGKEDVIVVHHSQLPLHHYVEIDCGHMGLLYSSTVHQQIIKWLTI